MAQKLQTVLIFFKICFFSCYGSKVANEPNKPTVEQQVCDRFSWSNFGKDTCWWLYGSTLLGNSSVHLLKETQFYESQFGAIETRMKLAGQNKYGPFSDQTAWNINVTLKMEQTRVIRPIVSHVWVATNDSVSHEKSNNSIEKKAAVLVVTFNTWSSSTEVFAFLEETTGFAYRNRQFHQNYTKNFGWPQNRLVATSCVFDRSNNRYLTLKIKKTNSSKIQIVVTQDKNRLCQLPDIKIPNSLSQADFPTRNSWQYLGVSSRTNHDAKSVLEAISWTFQYTPKPPSVSAVFIIGAIFGFIFILSIAIAVVLVPRCRRRLAKSGKKSKSRRTAASTDFSEVDIEQRGVDEPAQGFASLGRQRSSTNQSKRSTPANTLQRSEQAAEATTEVNSTDNHTSQPASQQFYNDMIDQLPYECSFELDARHFDFVNFESQSKDKKVRMAMFKNFENGESQPVIIKAPGFSDASLDKKEILDEFKLLAHIGPHKNLVALVGIIPNPSDFNVVLELCEGGRLDHFLHGSRSKFQPLNFADGILTRRRLILYAEQVAAGLQFLHSRGCVHGELAGRNVLLSKDFSICKLSNINKNLRNGPIAWPWAAPEVLRSSEFEIQSDVWSYGILLWEIMMLGQRPYLGVQFNNDFLRLLDEGSRLELPQSSDHDINFLISMCWKLRPEERPSLNVIKNYLQEWLTKNNRQNTVAIYQTNKIM